MLKSVPNSVLLLTLAISTRLHFKHYYNKAEEVARIIGGLRISVEKQRDAGK